MSMLVLHKSSRVSPSVILSLSIHQADNYASAIDICSFRLNKDIDNGFARMDLFLARIVDPIKGAATSTDLAVNQTKSALSSTVWVIRGATSIGDQAQTFKTTYGGYNEFSFVNATATSISAIVSSKVILQLGGRRALFI